MTIDEQAANLEASYAKYHRQTSQTWRTEEDRREALNTLKGHLREAERCLNLPPTSDTTSAILVTVSFTYMRSEADCVLRLSPNLLSFSL